MKGGSKRWVLRIRGRPFMLLLAEEECLTEIDRTNYFQFFVLFSFVVRGVPDIQLNSEIPSQDGDFENFRM